MDCSTHSSCSWDFPGKKTGMGCHFLLQGISWPRDLTQGSNPGLLHCRWILYQLNQQGSSQKAAWSHLTANSWLCSLKPHFCTSSATLFFMHTCAPTLFFFLPYRYACVLLICFPIVSGLMLSKKSMSNKYLLNWKIVIFAKKICLF